MVLVLDTTHSITAWSNEWRKLWRNAGGSPFVHPLWHTAFVDSHSGLRPELIGVRAQGELVAILPMRRDVDGVLRFLTSPNSDYEDVLVSETHRAAAISCIAGFLSRQRFELAEIPEESSLLPALAAKGIAALAATLCPGIELTAESMQDVTRRKSLLRHEKKIGRRGRLVLEEVTPDSADSALEGMFDQHIARRLAAGDDSVFLNSPMREFYRQLVTSPEFSDFGRFDVLRAGERSIAYHVGLYDKKTFIWYKPTFDLNLQNEGPGEVLFKGLVEQAFARGASYFDFSRGDEAFKLRFATTHRHNQQVRHRLPILHRVLRGVRRRALRVEHKLVAAAAQIAGAQRANKQPQSSLIRPADHLVLPSELRFDFGEVDLVAFAKLRSRCPQYVTTERMRAAIESQRRGDRLLVVWDATLGVPVHFAWLQVPSTPSDASTGADSDVSRTGVVRGLWTEPNAYGRGVCALALHYLASQGRKEGLTVSVEDLDEDPTSSAAIGKAGILAAAPG